MAKKWWVGITLIVLLCTHLASANPRVNMDSKLAGVQLNELETPVSIASFASMLSDDELAWLVANPVVTVGPDPFFHPIEFFDQQGRYQGLSADYLKLISQRTGINFKIERRDSWQQVVEEVKAGTIDMMAANVPNETNTDYLNFTQNYFSFPNVLVTSDTSLARTSDLSQWSGRKVAVVAGYPDEEFLMTQYPSIQQFAVESVVKGLEAVANGEVDGLLSFLPTVSYFMEQEGFTGLQITSVRVRFGGALAVKKQWPELVSILDKALSTISSRERNQIVERWVAFNNVVENTQLTPVEREWLSTLSQVRLGIDNSWAPFEYRDELGAHKGISSDYIASIAEWLDVPFNAEQNLPWSEVLERVKRGELDVLPAVAKTPSREQYLNFTEPYMSFPIVLITSLDAPLVNSINDFERERVAVVRNYAASEYMQQDYPDYSFYFVDSVEEGVLKLSNGEIDGFVGNMASISYAMQSLGARKIKIAATTGREFALSMAVRKDWPQMIPILQKALDRYTQAQKQSIHNSWINVRVETRSDWMFIVSIVAAIAGVMLMIVAIVVWKNKQLGREVQERKRVADDLKLLTLAVEQSPVSVLITDSSGDIIYVNPTCESVAGYSKQDLIGQNPRMMKSSRNDGTLYEELWQAITSGQTWHGEYYNCRADGSEYLVDSTIVPIRLSNGDISHYLEIKLDVTQQRADENRLRTFEKFVENSNQGLGMTSLTGEITFVNRALSDMLGESSPDDALSKPLGSYYIDEIGDKFNSEVMSTLLTKGAWSGELALTTSEGKTTPTLESLFVIHHEDGTPQCLADVITDISEQKQTQLKLEAAQQEAERATLIKSEFLAKMSHEIRTPMNAIIGMSHLALRTDLDETQRDYISKCYQAAQSLLSLINDILDFSKIESGKLELESIEFNLEQVFSNLSDLCAAKASEKGLELIFSIAPSVPKYLIGDPLRIGQILLNLTTNAIKFTNRGQIFIEVTTTTQLGKEIDLKFSVSDTGIGLTQQQMDKLFQSFQQADNSTTRQYGGTGLGLSICKNLVELMGGEINVNSVKGVGSQFNFNTKVLISEEHPNQLLTVPSPLAKMQVMVVDDNETALEVMSTYLEALDFSVDSFSDVHSALEALGAEPDKYRVVFLDWMMPGLTGLEVAEKIQSMYSKAEIPKIIMVTSFGREDVIRSAQELGLDGFLIKPVNQSTLFDAVVSSMSGSSHASHLHDQGDGQLGQTGSHETASVLLGKTLLLVEDNEINQQIGRELLESAGATVDVAENGAVALDKVAKSVAGKGLYDAVLMDLRMPVMDGIEATRALRLEYSDKALPIIFMTADAMKGVQETVLAAGANDYITKPIDPGVLFRVLVQVLAIENIAQTLAPKLDKQKYTEQLSDEVVETKHSLNTAKALRRLADNHTLYRSLLEKFVEQFATIGEQIASALEQPQWDTLLLVSHTLKGVSANIGADKLNTLATEIEQAIMAKQQEDIHAHLPELNSVMADTILDVERWLESNDVTLQPHNAAKQTQDEQSHVNQLIDELYDACSLNKAKVAKDKVRALNDIDLSDEGKALLEALTAAVNRYRFKEVCQQIEKYKSRDS